MSGGVNHLKDTVAWKLRTPGAGVHLLSPLNEKTPKGEAMGYLTAILYLAPHDLAGGKSVCPHSTAACRAGCLYSAGRGKTPRVEQARLRRTRLYLENRRAFLSRLNDDLDTMQRVAEKHGLELAIRLNGTSDILWERETPSIFDLFPRATFYDYTRTPLQHRRVPENWKLTFSLADDPWEKARELLIAGHSVAAVVPEEEKKRCADTWFACGEHEVQVIDGDEHDLRFLDPPRSLVLLKPKGRLTRGGPMVRAGLVATLRRHAT